MEEIKIPKKLINMCKTCVRKTRSDVTREGTLSSFFENKTWLKQGDIIWHSITKSYTKYKKGS